MSDELNFTRSRPRKPASGGIQAIVSFENGDIRAATDFNEILDAIKELDRRLSKLEGGLT